MVYKLIYTNKAVKDIKNLDIVAIATYEDSFPFIKRVIEIAKQEEPSRPVILGGPLVEGDPSALDQPVERRVE